MWTTSDPGPARAGAAYCPVGANRDHPGIFGGTRAPALGVATDFLTRESQSRPEALPLVTSFSAILRDASSIIFPSRLAAPAPFPSASA